VMIRVVDAAGNEIDKIGVQHYPAGEHQQSVLTSSKPAPGIYFCELKFGSEVQTISIVVQ